MVIGGVIKSIDLSTLEEDPFDADLVSDERVGNLQQAVVTEIIEASEIVESKKTAESTETPEVAGAMAKALIGDYQTIEIPFEKGLDWAAKFQGVNNKGKDPALVSDVLKVGDVIWVEQRDQDTWLLADVPKVEGALVSIDSSNGAIQAMVGGFDFFRNKFNRATQARRQPGSNFKPFIYSAALEKGFTAASIINDAPVVFDDDSLEATWRPENYSGKFYGPTRLREALVKSRNLVSIRILQALGLRGATRYVQRFGFEKAHMPYDLSLALGSGTFAPIEIARGYSVFSNDGFLIDPYYLQRIVAGNGNVIFRHNPRIVCPGCEQAEPVETEDDQATTLTVALEADEAPQAITESLGESAETTAAEEDIEIDLADVILPVLYAPQVISNQNAYIMRSMMREVVSRGTAVRAKALGRSDIGGKTGTTNDQVDAWFSGFNDKIVTTSWVGFDNQQTLGRRETGGRAALPMWVEYMRVALDGMPETIEDQPEGLVTVRIDADTGKRATLDSVNSRFEIFRAENAPLEKRVASSSGNGEVLGGVIENTAETEEEIVEDIF